MMDSRLEELFDGINTQELEELECEAPDFSLDRAAQNRILSSSMRKAGISMKKTNGNGRRSKKYIALIVAAAVACTGGIAAYAAYTNGVWGGMKGMFSEDVTEDEKETLEDSAVSFSGTVIENTFEGIDFTVDGVVKDVNADYIVVTARRTDGSPFELKDGNMFRSVFRFERPYIEGENIYKDEDIYMSGDYCNMELNEDGSISVLFQTCWNDRTVILGFEDIASLKKADGQDQEYEHSYTDILNKGIEMESAANDIYNSTTDEEKTQALENYNSLRKDYEDALAGITEEVYKGRFLFIANPSEDNSVVVIAEDNEQGCEITMSVMSVYVKAPENGDLLNEKDKPNNIVLKFEDGSQAEYDTYGGIGTGEKDSDKLAYAIVSLDKPIDPESVTEVIVNGCSVKVK